MSHTISRGEQPFELDESQLVELFGDDSGAERAVAHMTMGTNDDVIAAHMIMQVN